jgi:hypothetical protein
MGLLIPRSPCMIDFTTSNGWVTIAVACPAIIDENAAAATSFRRKNFESSCSSFLQLEAIQKSL